MNFEGHWRIVSSPDFDDDYLHEEVEPFITLWQKANDITGEYHVGYQSGTIDAKAQSATQATLSFEGQDEMDRVSGRGTFTLAEDKLTLILECHMGDTFTFEAVRGKEEPA